MILVPRWLAVTIVAGAVLALAGIGVLGYRLVLTGGGASSRADAQLLLYLGVAASTVLLLALLGSAGRTRHISRELDKMIAMNRYGDFSPEVAMRKLGGIGEKVTMLYFRLNALNEKRSLKISALSELVEFLTMNVKAPLFVSDIAGEILYAGKRAAEELDTTRAALLNATVQETLPDLNFDWEVSELHRTTGTRVVERDGQSITAVPIHNRMSELSYVVWVLAKEGIMTEGTSPGTPAEQVTGKTGILRRVLSRAYRRGERK